MVSTFSTTPDGKHICPNCEEAYEPNFDSKSKAKEHGDEVDREQYITGICSQDCWDAYLGL